MRVKPLTSINIYIFIFSCYVPASCNYIFLLLDINQGQIVAMLYAVNTNQMMPSIRIKDNPYRIPWFAVSIILHVNIFYLLWIPQWCKCTCVCCCANLHINWGCKITPAGITLNEYMYIPWNRQWPYFGGFLSSVRIMPFVYQDSSGLAYWRPRVNANNHGRCWLVRLLPINNTTQQNMNNVLNHRR